MCGALVCIGMNAIYYTRVVNCFLVSVWGQYWTRVAWTSDGVCTFYDWHDGGTVALYTPYRTHSWIWKTWGEGLMLNVGFTTRVLQMRVFEVAA